MTVDTAIELRTYIELHNQGLLKAYTAHKSRIREHRGVEQTVLAGGYRYRQILELVQNGVDAILEAHDYGLAAGLRNRVQVLLRGSRLYVANNLGRFQDRHPYHYCKCYFEAQVAAYG